MTSAQLQQLLAGKVEDLIAGMRDGIPELWKHSESGRDGRTRRIVEDVREVALRRRRRTPSAAELLAALILDLKDPVILPTDSNDTSAFQSQEAASTHDVSEISARLGLDPSEAAHLSFIVAQHADANCLSDLGSAARSKLLEHNEFRESLGVVQEASALSCTHPRETSQCVYWGELVELPRSFNAKIHPVIIYPFTQPRTLDNLRALYTGLIQRLDANRLTYSQPITVINQQTYRSIRNDVDCQEFLKLVEDCSELVPTWSVDSGQMWLSGLGKAFEAGEGNEATNDVYWLIPGDFNYASDVGRQVLGLLETLPWEVAKGEVELCIGEIKVSPNSPKQLIDTYGTYALLYNWFPLEAQAIRQITDKPRSEFFAISHGALRDALASRWYAYSQTVVLLLQIHRGRRVPWRVKSVSLGSFVDEDQGREKLANAMSQIERTERVLKLFWRENTSDRSNNWTETFKQLDHQSEQIRGTALVILEQILQQPRGGA